VKKKHVRIEEDSIYGAGTMEICHPSVTTQCSLQPTNKQISFRETIAFVM